MKIFKKILFLLLGLLIFILIFWGYFSIGSAPQAEKISWGVNFSKSQAEYLGLDWQKVYSSLIDDLGVKKIKIDSQWDLVEPEEGEYNFEDLDWQIKEAEKKGVDILLVIGLRTPRWPECHEPQWAKFQIPSAKFQNSLLNYIEKVVNRYKDSTAIWAWQVENEPFFPFGECPKINKDFLKKEINLVKSLDPERPVIISDSGEFSFWITAAKLGDIVGTTLHRRVWFKEIKSYVTYPLPPVFYWKRAQIIKKFFGKEVICGELQAEPWCPQGISNCGLKEQAKTMNLEKFKENIEFARQTGLKEFYLWGAEWWYWLKEKQDNPEIWEEAKKLFSEQM